MKQLLDEDDDWIEGVRRWLYPKLHPYLERVGGYGVGTVALDQFVGTYYVGEEAFEEILVDLGFERNPIACYKTDEHGHLSEGSWALRAPDDEYDLVETGMQLHVTVFAGKVGLEVFAHYEDDWRAAPLDHLREKRFDAVAGRVKMEQLLDNQTYLDCTEADETPTTDL